MVDNPNPKTPWPLLLCKQVNQEFMEYNNTSIVELGYHPVQDDPGAPDRAMKSVGIALSATNPLALSHNTATRNNLQRIFIDYDTRFHLDLVNNFDRILGTLFGQTTDEKGTLVVDLPHVWCISIHIQDLWWGDELAGSASRIVKNKWAKGATSSSVNLPMHAVLRFLDSMPALRQLWISGGIFQEPLIEFLAQERPNITIHGGRPGPWADQLGPLAEVDVLDTSHRPVKYLSVPGVLPLPKWLRNRLFQYGSSLSKVTLYPI
jgi:hypothetical protein